MTEKELKEPVQTIPVGCTCKHYHKSEYHTARVFKIGCPVHTK